MNTLRQIINYVEANCFAWSINFTRIERDDVFHENPNAAVAPHANMVLMLHAS